MIFFWVCAVGEALLSTLCVVLAYQLSYLGPPTTITFGVLAMLSAAIAVHMAFANVRLSRDEKKLKSKLGD